VWARVPVWPIDRRHVGRVVSAGLVTAATLVVFAAIAVLLAATAKPAAVDSEDLRTEGVETTIALDPAASATPTDEVTATPASQSSAPQTPSDETAVPVSSEVPPTDPIANLRLSIQQQVNTGNLNPLKSGGLYTKVDEIARSINAGNFDDARHKIQDFRNMLVSLLSGGQVTASGYDVLTSNLDAIPVP
jgi:serine/threonine-protein kinase